MKTRLLIIIGVVMMTIIPFVTYAMLDWYSDSVLQDSFDTDTSPKPGDKYYIEPERKAELVAVEQDLRSKISQLHQKSPLTSYAVNLDHATKKIIVIVETEQFNSEIEEIISEYPDDIQIIFYNGKIEHQEFESEENTSTVTSSVSIDPPSGLSQEDRKQLQIQRVLDHCNTIGERTDILIGYENGTHHIDNIVCEWQIKK